MGNVMITSVQFNMSRDYSHKELATHQVKKHHKTWDAATDRQKAVHAAIFDTARVLGITYAKANRHFNVSILGDINGEY